MKIEVLNPIECRIKKSFARAILPALSYRAEYWKPANPEKGKYAKSRHEYPKHFFSRKEKDYWYFWTGLLPRVKKFCNNRNISLNITEDIFDIVPHPPNLNGIKFRDDQIRQLNAAIKAQRGVIKAPTGSGKTILQMGLTSAFSSLNVLYLSHTIDIRDQTIDELKKYFKNVSKLWGPTGNGRKLFQEPLPPKIVVTTVQTLKNIDPMHYCDYFHMVIVDECHHVSKQNGMYAKVLSNLLAPLRYGFTATEPTLDEAKFSLEGLIGPMIDDFTIQEAVALGILAKPKIKLIKTKFDPKIREARTYPNVYSLGVVQNSRRNHMIVDLAHKYMKENKTCLIMVKLIEHGELISQIGRFPFVQGETLAEVRHKTKKWLIDKKVKCVVTTNVWKEGVNIPSLNVVINAAGGKSEIATLQAIGRGLRKTDDKSTVTIVDFFDSSHPYLISHFGERITLYMDQGWL